MALTATASRPTQNGSSNGSGVDLTPRLIRRIRLLTHLTQTQFAKLMRVNIRTICRWETGASSPHEVFKSRLLEMRR